jgi:hypothetical protein
MLIKSSLRDRENKENRATPSYFLTDYVPFFDACAVRILPHF